MLHMQKIDSWDVSEFTVAVVDADGTTRANVCGFLSKSGFQTWGAGSAEDFYVRQMREKADLMVTELDLPGQSGLKLIENLARQHMLIVVHAAQGDVEHRIAALRAGARQYFVKPTDMKELAAGIRSQLYGAAGAEDSGQSLGRWRVDVAGWLIAPNQMAVRLTSRELDFLICLASAKGQTVTKEVVLEALGHGDALGGFHRIASMLNRLRRKTEAATDMRLPVRSVFGRGLVFVP